MHSRAVLCAAVLFFLVTAATAFSPKDPMICDAVLPLESETAIVVPSVEIDGPASRLGARGGDPKRFLVEEYNWAQIGRHPAMSCHNHVEPQDSAVYVWYKQQTGSGWMPWGGYPIEADGYAVFFDHNPGNVTCYDIEDGTVVWSHLAGTQLYRGRNRPSQPTIFSYAGVSYVVALGGTSGGQLICWNLATGVEQWRQGIPLSSSLGAYKAKPFYMDGYLYFTLHSEAGATRPLYKVNPATGDTTILFTRSYESWGGVCCDSNYIYVSQDRAGTAMVHKYDINTGSLATSSPGQGSGLISTPPAYYNGRIYIAFTGKMCCFNAADMTLVWSRSITGTIDSQWLAVDEFADGNVYVSPYGSSSSNYVYAFKQSDGTDAWATNPYRFPGGEIYNGALSVTGNQAGPGHCLYATPGFYGQSATLYVIDADSGTTLQKLAYPTGENMFTGMCRGNGYILSKTGYGSLYCWEVEDIAKQRSVAPTAILVPAGTVDSGQIVTPRVVIRNKSEDPADRVDITIQIEDGTDAIIYIDSTYVLNLAGGLYDTFEFTPWTPVGRDSLTVTTWTFWESDSNNLDDTLRARFMVRTRNVGITQIIAPVDTLDEAVVVYPRCRVYNYGTQSETFNTNFRIGAYNHNVLVSNLPPNFSRIVTATESLLTLPGTWLHTVTADLAGDIHPEDNVVIDTFWVRGIVAHDVAVEEILAPIGFYDTLTTVVPMARVANYGGSPATFWTWFTVWDTTTDAQVYRESLQVNLGGGGNTTVAFPGTTFTVLGPYVGQCSTYLFGDQNNLNDVMEQGFIVSSAQHNVSLSMILAPAGSVDSGAAITPTVVVRNGGLHTENFPAWFELPGGYLATANVIDLAPGGADTIVFTPDWNANFRDSLTARAWTLLAGDERSEDDTLEQAFYVQVGDVGVVEVIFPVDTVADATWMIPEAEVRNYGTKMETFDVEFRIGLFLTTATVESLGPGTSVDVTFPDSLLSSPGIWLDQVTTLLAGDINPTNNVGLDTFWVPGVLTHDVGVVEIFEPTGTYDTTNVITPTASVKNFGTVAETWTAFFTILDDAGTPVYTESQSVTLDTGVEDTLVFPSLQLTIDGDYVGRCSTFLASDQNWINNVVAEPFVVSDPTLWPGGWVEVGQMPLQPSGKPVKRGGWLALNDDGTIYAGKGYKTGDFYKYDPLHDEWTPLALIKLGRDGRMPKKGTKGVCDGDNYVYMTKGNNTLGWWRYDIAQDSWFQLTDVPEGPRRKRVKGGTDLAYVVQNDTGYVYMLKGYRTEFYKYNTATGTWITLPDAPTGIKYKWDKGSWIVAEPLEGPSPLRQLFAHKAKYYSKATYEHELWKYDLGADTWFTTQLNGMPLYGLHGGRIKKKKAKDGGCAAYYRADHQLYALKGGNTQQFWRYDIAGDTWTESDTVPTRGSTGRRKRVKYGADIVHWGGGAFFALKGNKTVETWRYVIPHTAYQPAGRSGVMAEPTSGIRKSSLTIAPNPLTGGVAGLRYSLPKAGPATLTVYDVSGRSVLRQHTLASRTGTLMLNVRHLSAGIYLVRLDAGPTTVTRKLVIQH